MTWEGIGAFISTIGFPVFVAVYLLIRTDKIVRENTEVTKDLIVFLKAHLTK